MTDDTEPTVMKRLRAARGSEIRAAREKRGLSQAELAELTGTSQQTIDRIERGAVEHSRALPKLRAFLGLELFGADRDLHEVERRLPGLPPLSVEREMLAAGEILNNGRVPVIANRNGQLRLVDALPRVFPYEYVEGACAFLITDAEMEPVLKLGDIVVFNPHLPPRPGDEIGRPVDGLVKLFTLVEDEGEKWVAKTWNPEQKYRFPKRSDGSIDVVVAKYGRNR